MTKIDQFESVFRAAEKTQFQLDELHIETALLIVDQPESELAEYIDSVRALVSPIVAQDLSVMVDPDSKSVDKLLQAVEQVQPDLIVTYRNLHLPAGELPYSLGMHVDVLTQVLAAPVLLLPTPPAARANPQCVQPVKSVVVVTDHLAGDHLLISYGIHCAPPDGNLILAHVEDAMAFERYMDAIGKIADIDSETAREEILHRLLKDPADYTDSCRQVMEESGVPTNVQSVVKLGHHLSDYRQLVDEYRADLLVLNTKDDDQLAMHGVAYPLTIELRETPMLLL